MIIIPEIKTVVILVPRTGSGTLRRAVQAHYPRSMLLYRHMEADGVPHGYDRWRRVGVVRRPLDRMWSLYKFLRTSPLKDHSQAYCDTMRESVRPKFCDWLVENRVPFADPYDADAAFHPLYNVMHIVPENRRSQWSILRPDLGTEIFPFENMDDLYRELRLKRPTLWSNTTEDRLERPVLTEAAMGHVRTFMSWEAEFCGAYGSDAWQMESCLGNYCQSVPLPTIDGIEPAKPKVRRQRADHTL